MASVIYLTDTRYGQTAWQHPSARHRCYHYADALLADRGSSVVTSMECLTPDLLKKFDHVVFHRPVWNKRFEHALKICRQATVAIHADYDDLVFHPDFAPHSPLYVSGNRAINKVEHQFEKTHKAAGCFDSFLVSTVYLDEQLRAVFPQAVTSVLPNSLPLYFVSPATPRINSEQKTIGYFPGSRGHAEDFKTVVPALKEITGPDVRLLIAGRVNESDYAGLDNVVCLPFTDYSNYLQLLSLVDVSIAPLVDNIFNRSKSAVKLIESVSVGTPVVATANRDMQDHANDLAFIVDGSTPAAAGEWVESLTAALSQASGCINKNTLVAELAERYSVKARMPVLREHLQCAA